MSSSLKTKSSFGLRKYSWHTPCLATNETSFISFNQIICSKIQKAAVLQQLAHVSHINHRRKSWFSVKLCKKRRGIRKKCLTAVFSTHLKTKVEFQHFFLTGKSLFVLQALFWLFPSDQTDGENAIQHWKEHLRMHLSAIVPNFYLLQKRSANNWAWQLQNIISNSRVRTQCLLFRQRPGHFHILYAKYSDKTTKTSLVIFGQ